MGCCGGIEGHVDYLSPVLNPSEVLVLTYNAFLRFPIVTNNGNDYKDIRVDLIVEQIARFDIVGMQEVFGSFSKRRKRFIECSKQQGFKWIISAPKPPFLSTFLVDGGIMILSKYPIVENDWFRLTKGVQSDSLATKGILWAKIQLNSNHPNSYIHIFNTHLQASYGGNASNIRNDEVRLRQVKQIKEWVLEKTKKDTFPILLVGDFNVNSRAEGDSETDEYFLLLKALDDPRWKLVDLLKERHGNHPITLGDSHLDENLNSIPMEIALTDRSDHCCNVRLDYIFYIMKEESEQVKIFPEGTAVENFFVQGFPFTQLSDHYGISARINCSFLLEEDEDDRSTEG